MLTRLYINNFRCFVNFEYRPEGKQLILGANGSGKSSLADVLSYVRALSIGGTGPDPFLASRRMWYQSTKWLDLPQQTIEMEAVLGEVNYLYRVVVQGRHSPPRFLPPRVTLESVQLDGRPIFTFADGEVRLFNDNFEQTVAYPFDWSRSALATITAQSGNQKLTRFKDLANSLTRFSHKSFQHDEPLRKQGD